MPVWKFDDPQPGDKAVRLGEWLAFQMPDGARHFVGTGYMSYGREARVTSALEGEVDLSSAMFVTRSGRQYQLVGRPGLSLDADYVLNRWLGRMDIARGLIVDVTQTFWSALSEANSPSRPVDP